MAPKKGKNKGGKKVLGKGEGMGGTIGLMEKPEKKCVLPCVKSFAKPPACCPLETCAVPPCCPSTPLCPTTQCPGQMQICFMQ